MRRIDRLRSLFDESSESTASSSSSDESVAISGQPQDLLEGLNDRQREAVTHPKGALLVLAGAGSGKTRVITHRIAWLILEQGVLPHRVTAMTFTNKAAGEMKERVRTRVGPQADGAWIGTFHSFCLRVLRRDGARIGLESGFNIYDSADQLSVIKRKLKALTGESNPPNPRGWLSKISRCKNAMESPSAVEKRALSPDDKLLAALYGQYQAELRTSNAVDFDDLLVRVLELFDHHPDVAARYAEQTEHLLVDEYQDTNRPQYRLVRALSAKHGNLCVVGDEDQSIYRFRGAEIKNILDFERDHPNATVVRLEQNYRSTGNILAVAGTVIANNLSRKGKTLWTEAGDGELIELFAAPDDRTEAAYVAGQARALREQYEYEDMAVLYRTNAQSRQFEEMFRREKIPYRVVGSVQFYERKEVKDLLSYLRLAVNPADDIAFRRVVNVPTRGIGAGTLAKIESTASGFSLSLFEAAQKMVEQAALPARAGKNLQGFLEICQALQARANESTVVDAIETTLDQIHYKPYLQKMYGAEADDRWDNIRSFVSAAVEYEEEESDPSLLGFLDRSALVADTDQIGEGHGITMMTIHCAKGLEFPVVFLVGLEENLFPHSMSNSSPEDVEEERRLCYVAMTRARQRLLLSWAGFRRTFGQYLPSNPSRFLTELPMDRVEERIADSQTSGFRDRTQENYRSTGSSRTNSSAARAARSHQSQSSIPAYTGTIKRTAAPTPSIAPAADGFNPGVLVSHPRFGTGEIQTREGGGKNLKLTIKFASFGIKKILPAYTKLKIEGG